MNLIHPAHFVRERFGTLLGNMAGMLAVDLRLWSPDIEQLLAAPSPTATAAPPQVRAAAARAATLGETVQARTAHGLPLLAVPVRAGQGLAAVITVVPRDEGPQRTLPQHPRSGEALQHLQPFMEDLARTATQQLDLAEEHARAAEDLSGTSAELTLLRRVSEKLSDPGNTRAALRFILEHGRATAAADLGLLMLRGTETMLISERSAPGRPGDRLARPAIRRLCSQVSEQLEGLRGRSVHGPASELLPDVPSLPDPTQVAASRLRLGSRRAGFLALVRFGGIPFGAREITLLESLAEQAALALRGGELYENLNQFLMSTVKSLVSAIEAKDNYTSGHSIRVNILAMLLGREIGLPNRQLESLKWASILHDVGKIGMPESILNKEGRLTPAEYDIVKQHSQRGYDVLRPIRQFRDAAQAVLLHHERIDGLGYPLGISGTTIPLLARIIAVADTFDALTTTRPYRAAQTQEEAFAEIARVAGRQLDPTVVNALERLLPFLKENHLMLEAPRRAA
jgi:HD-GYP domain-containing protein (c-di-GMP phosphodiesterase class II)